MYLRKNKVRSGGVHRNYLSIAHNVWSQSAASHGRHQSRPVSLASLGREDRVDRQVAEELVGVLESIYGTQPGDRGRSEQHTRAAAYEIKSKHQSELEILVSIDYGLREKLPCARDRVALLTNLIRSAAEEPELRGEGLDSIKARLDAHF